MNKEVTVGVIIVICGAIILGIWSYITNLATKDDFSQIVCLVCRSNEKIRTDSLCFEHSCVLNAKVSLNGQTFRAHVASSAPIKKASDPVTANLMFQVGNKRFEIKNRLTGIDTQGQQLNIFDVRTTAGDPITGAKRKNLLNKLRSGESNIEVTPLWNRQNTPKYQAVEKQ